MENNFLSGSFSQKILKKIHHLAFTDKVKVIKAHMS